MKREYKDIERGTRLSYINANDRRAYIDTGLVLNEFTLEADVKINSNSGYVPIITGYADFAGQKNGVLLGYQTEQNYLYGKGGNKSGYFQFRNVSYLGKRQTYKITFGLNITPVLYVNNQSHSITYSSGYDNPKTPDNILIFGNLGSYPYGDNLHVADFNYYGGKIWDINGNLLRDFTPMLMGNKPGLFDSVENKFYPSAGSEDFYYE